MFDLQECGDYGKHLTSLRTLNPPDRGLTPTGAAPLPSSHPLLRPRHGGAAEGVDCPPGPPGATILPRLRPAFAVVPIVQGKMLED